MRQDFSKLSREDKLAVRIFLVICTLKCTICLLTFLQLLEKDSPELFNLLEDFDEHLTESLYTLHPLVTVARDTPTFAHEVRVYPCQFGV